MGGGGETGDIILEPGYQLQCVGREREAVWQCGSVAIIFRSNELDNMMTVR